MPLPVLAQPVSSTLAVSMKLTSNFEEDQRRRIIVFLLVEAGFRAYWVTDLQLLSQASVSIFCFCR